MTTNTKIYVGLGTLVVAVFGATVINRAAPEAPKVQPTANGETVENQASGELLRYDYSHIFFDPTNSRAAFREYQGFYERSDYKIPLWFCNPNAVPVTMSFLNTSCGACSFAEIADVPTPKVNGTAEPEPFGAVFGATASLALDSAEHKERMKLYEAIPEDKWQRIIAQNSTAPVGDPKAVATFPAGSPENPRWGVIRLNVKVNDSKTLTATIGLQKPGMSWPVPVEFKATVGLSPLCEVEPSIIQFGDLSESFTSVNETIYYFSTTRTVGGNPDTELPLPVVGGLKGDPFLTATKPLPMTTEDRATLAEKLGTARKAPIRISGGYKFQLVLSRTAPDPNDPGKTREIDVGPAERVLNIAPSYGTIEKVPQILVKSNTVGVLTVEGGVIDLKTYLSKDGVEKSVRLFTERPGIELEALSERSEPQYLGLDLSAPEVRNNRTYWTLKVIVKPGVGGGRLLPGHSVLVRIKSTGQLVRIPVTGNGSS
jgi:hypothetical protein